MDKYEMNSLYQSEASYGILKKREELLEKLIEEKKQVLRQAPKGKLHIVKKRHRKSNVQYYHRIDGKDKSGKYIRKSQKQLAESLAQKEYDQKLVEVFQKEIESIQCVLKNKSNILGVYEKLTEDQKKLIVPAIETDELYIEHWLREEYEKNYMEESKVYSTKKNEKVRSKSEVIIANLLEEYGIPYKYERPLYWNESVRAVPDFTVLNVKKRKEFIWEHFGMMGDVGYSNKAVSKISSYSQLGFFPGKNLILTFETADVPLNTKNIEQIIQEYLL